MFATLLLAFYFAGSGHNSLPFSIDATQNAAAEFPDAPHLESPSFAQWKGRWVFIGGRIAGYHATGGASADFSRLDANRNVWVIDTTCKPARTYHVQVDSLPDTLALVKDEWVSTGQSYYQDGSSLYIAGGYGQAINGQWLTYQLLTKIDLPRLIEGVIQGKLDSTGITFLSSPLVQSAGGDLIKLSDGYFYLVMGHVFTGSYTAFEAEGERRTANVSQTYLDEIRKLRIVVDSHGSLAIFLVDRFHDASEFHRRDLNVAKIQSPQGIGLAAYGGVFTPEQLNYSKPVYIASNGRPVVDIGFDQRLNTYKCAKLLIYDAALSTMYTTFFGGISRYRWDAEADQYLENSRIGDRSSSSYLDGLQWSDQVSTLVRNFKDAGSQTQEFVQPQTLPAFVGTDAIFIPVADTTSTGNNADILDFKLLKDTSKLVGYLYGGIRAFPFRFPYDNTSKPYNSGTVPTKPNDLILKVYLNGKR